MASEKTSWSLPSLGEWLWDFIFEGSPVPLRLALGTTFATFVPAVIVFFIVPHMTPVPFLGALAMINGIRGSGYRVATFSILVGACAIYLVLLFGAWAPLIAAALAMISGLFGSFGHARPMIVVCITWSVFTGQIIPENDPELVVGLYMSGALASFLVARLTSASNSFPAEDERSRTHALVLGVLFASGFAFATWFGRQYFDQLGNHGYFFPLAFAFLCLPPHSLFFGNAIKRCLGTGLGWLVSIGLNDLSLPIWGSVVIGVSCFFLFQWLLSWSKLIAIMFVTTAIIVLIGIFAPDKPIAEERMDAVLAAAAMATVLAFIAMGVLKVVSPKALRELIGASSNS
ncbi:hypothetical protein FMN63_27860 [Stappia sp. BW2]|uniref:FUSC family protein n=1 Tax=Stappia sp. BW2 TaxID=2592622 RepID=UPI0011DEB696|nr:FUSC family protein [Stappia sp. BW2]TYC64047.1 hypothetical protein FMN63_27860 [Stappia sp. BW2]